MTLNVGQLIPVLWLVWGIYWWIAARSVKAVVRREPVASRLAHAIPLAISAVLLGVASFPAPLGTPLIDVTEPVLLAAIGLVAAGLMLCVWARIALGGNWSGTVTLKHDHEIVRTGPYRMIRHPIYTGLLLMFLGTALARGDWRGALALVIAFAALWRKLRMEERWLGEFFGSAYAEYRAASWALVPWLL